MSKLKIVVPKGRLNKEIVTLLSEIGMGLKGDERNYRPRVADSEVEAKIMKPQNIPQLVGMGFHDVGFTGYDWIRETGADVEEVMDLGFNPVRIVAAVPQYVSKQDLYCRKLTAVSEYEEIATEYLKKQCFDFNFIRTFGATEVFPPDDADIIIDNTSTGKTLEEHGLKIVDVVTTSTTRMIANREAMKDPFKRSKIEAMVTLINSVLDARNRVMLEMNVSADLLESLVSDLPCMRSPTVAPLYNDEGYAVRIVVPRSDSPAIITRLRRLGATDILESQFRKVVI